MPTTVWPWYTKRYTCSAFPSFEQGQWEMSANRGLAHVDAKLEQLVVDAARAPKRVRQAHHADQSSLDSFCRANIRAILSRAER
jgi:hypothetical protein